MNETISKMFSEADLTQIRDAGLTQDRIVQQIKIFTEGVEPIHLNRPCTVDDGIEIINEKQAELYVELHERELDRGRMMKFVPASGAASRMFKDWYQCLEQGDFDNSADEAAFNRNLNRYPFFDDLVRVIRQNGQDFERLMQQKKYTSIMEYVLSQKGLNYGQLPKALIKFHKYPDGTSRTAIEEHLVEAAQYIKDENGNCRIHFTVPDQQMERIDDFLDGVKERYEKMLDVRFHVDLSVQSPSTDTIAVDLQNRPFRDEDGKLTFRPGGHGALLKNLQSTKGDLVFIKNIDNVLPDRLKPRMVHYKKVLGGYLIAIQEDIFKYLRLLTGRSIKKGDWSSITEFCRTKLKIRFPSAFESISQKQKSELIYQQLNRPIRVCGMVRNVGEPGGGPFWVDEKDGMQSLQIVEEVHIDSTSEQQRKLWKSGTHFNPVDIVCSLKNFRGEVFDLNGFVDAQAVCIARKSDKGRDLKALELPGLWNSSMSFWNTIFLEMPLDTFNPVKTVDDLLRSTHQS
ncbi:MAG: DUF4301 family protein [Deltaproteobacteria bacterium]|nr:DUF4301 family protein [Deltaproteobacteria bacterium]